MTNLSFATVPHLQTTTKSDAKKENMCIGQMDENWTNFWMEVHLDECLNGKLGYFRVETSQKIKKQKT